MPKRLALIHTASFLSAVFADLCKEIMPAVNTFNIVDESLLGNTIAEGRLTVNTSKRVAQYIQSAEEAGADLIVVTCSSLGPAVEAARPFVSVPVLRIDEAMADLAVRSANRIGIIATLPTTLAPTLALVKRTEIQHWYHTCVKAPSKRLSQATRIPTIAWWHKVCAS